MPNLNPFARITMKSIAGASAVIAVMSLASAAGAVTLSTGVGPLGGTEPDWTLTSSPGSTSLTIVSGAQNYPGAWVVAPPGSNWITPYAGGGTTATDALAGEYDYSLTFGNPGASVAIQWSSDNDATFYLNNVLLPTTVSSTGYGGLVSFTIAANQFQSGNNAFLVKVQNDPCSSCGSNGNPTGLLVSATTVTPLPAALPLFASGAGVLGLFGWCKRKKKTPAVVSA